MFSLSCRFGFLSAILLSSAAALFSSSAMALTLKEAAAVALESNPEIGQAIENREAIEFKTAYPGEVRRSKPGSGVRLTYAQTLTVERLDDLARQRDLELRKQLVSGGGPGATAPCLALMR